MSDVSSSTASLTPGEDSVVESILTDIPFFCVGLMTFGIFTFILFLKRVDIIVLYLYASSFLAFTAAVLDLTHILTEGKPMVVTIDGIVRDTPSGLVSAREVGLALSVGCLYVFLWHLVAQCPKSEQTLVSEHDSISGRPIAHSASWRRWGLLGMVLQWSLLCFSIAIAVLQIIWRIVPLDSQFTMIYTTETTAEIVVSALFIIKIILNMFLSRQTPWWRSLQANLALLISLGISGGVGLGNLVSLLFSESILGRFLRAVETYILILFVLITTFYKSPAKSQRNSPLLFEIEQGRSSIQVSEKPVDPTQPITPPSSHSAINRLGRPSTVTWILPQSGQRSSAGSFYSENLEPTFFVATLPQSPNPPGQKISVTQESSRILPISAPKESESNDALEEDKHLTSVSAISISSYYGMDQRVSAEAPLPLPDTTRETDSPVYGLHGIVARSRGQPKHRPQSSLSFNEILRQQNELDKSIAALRLYAMRDFSAEDVTPSKPVLDSVLPKVSQRRTIDGFTSSHPGHESTSNRSEFSLSIFPEPPPIANVDGLPNSVKLERLAGRARTLRLQPIAPTGVEVVDVDARSSLPISPNFHFGGMSRMESAGTQYDVTSFIGGLTLPGRDSNLITGSGGAGTGSGLATAGTHLSDVDSDERSPPAPNIRPLFLEASLVVEPGVNVNVEERLRDKTTLLRPLLLGSGIPVEEITVMGSSTKVPIGPRNRLRREISKPLLRDGGEQRPGMFEQPRAPPLLNNFKVA